MNKLNKKILIFFLFLIISFALTIIVNLVNYSYSQNKNLQMKNICKSDKLSNKPDKNISLQCYISMYELLLPELLIYKVKVENNNIFYYIDNSSLYFIPEFVTKYADVLMGYGIGNSCKFEDNYTKIFNKTSYAFDCTNRTNICKNANFEPECIATDDYIITDILDPYIAKSVPQISSGKIHYFKDKIKQLNLENKKIYVKMDIAGAEDYALQDILKYSDNIPAISLVMHLDNIESIIKKQDILKLLNDKYFLISRISPKMKETKADKYRLKYTSEYWSDVLILNYVNKNIAKKHYLPLNQNNKIKYQNFENKNSNYLYMENPYPKINPIIVISKKLEIFSRYINRIYN